MFERLEARRILNLWRDGAGGRQGITAGLVDWALQATGDMPCV